LAVRHSGDDENRSGFAVRRVRSAATGGRARAGGIGVAAHARARAVDLVKWRRALRHPLGPSKSVVRHVLLTLATWGDKDGGSMYPSIETLSVATRLHRETVRRALEEADRDGWVVRSARGRYKNGQATSYEYGASVPAEWQDFDSLDHPWERDPQWVSERGRRREERAARLERPSPERGHVPVQSGGATTSERSSERRVPVVSASVPVQDSKRPGPEFEVSLSRTAGVPTQDCPTSSSTSSGPPHWTSSVEGALARTALPRSISRARNGSQEPETREELERKLRKAWTLWPDYRYAQIAQLVRGATVADAQAVQEAMAAERRAG
jgi:hypothetical protein